MLENTGSGPLTLFAMDITNILNGQPMGTHIFQDEESLTRIGLVGLVLEPGDTLTWNDAHPAVSDWNAREYRFHFRDDQGSQVSLEFLFEELDRQNEPTDYSQDQGQQLRTLRPDAAFQVEVYPGVYWVPAATLGGSRYSNAQIHTMLDLSPEEKQQQISTLYEALQLFQVGGFYASDDNVRIYENGINWEHHKPGYHAVRTNTGCCATDSNWLRYILDGDYQEVGFISTSQRDGSGHIFNYILQEGSYYIIDLTHHRANDAPFLTAEENGDLNAYRATDYILGNIHMVQDIQAFVDYVQQDFSDPPGMMFMHAAENALPLDSLPADGKVQIVYSTLDKDILRVIFDDPSDALELGWADGPFSGPDWNTLP